MRRLAVDFLAGHRGPSRAADYRSGNGQRLVLAGYHWVPAASGHAPGRTGFPCGLLGRGGPAGPLGQVCGDAGEIRIREVRSGSRTPQALKRPPRRMPGRP